MCGRKNKISIVVFVILASIYLTFIVDVFTLNTMLKRIFIFCYFIGICSISTAHVHG